MHDKTDPTDVYYYLERGLKPTQFSVYTHKKPLYLERFIEKKENSCPVHGLHNDWSYKPNRRFGKYFYDIIKCKRCSILYSRFWHFKHPVKAMIKDGRGHAKSSSITFDLQNIDIYSMLKKQKNKCALSGLKFDLLYNRPSLDQKIAGNGYTVENSQLLQKNVNIMKSNFIEDYFLKLINLVYQFRVVVDGKFGSPKLLYQVGLEIKDRDYVERRVTNFQSGKPVKCAVHGDHNEWSIRYNKQRQTNALVCKKCKRSTLRKSRARTRAGEIPHSDELSNKIANYRSTGLSDCEKHGRHSDFKLKSSRHFVCNICAKENRDNFYDRFPLKAIYSGRKSEIKTKEKKRNFTIEYKGVEKIYSNQNGRCWYSNIPLKKGRMGGISMDRMDNKKGYTYENVCLTFADINKMKSSINIEEFLKLITKIYLNNVDKSVGLESER